MNVYDWDKTIYDGDSSIDFYKFNLRKDKKLSKLWLKQTKVSWRLQTR
ncbi:haloacid dehalogenase-like hydrolase [Erysipelothrix sp. D19-032]